MQRAKGSVPAGPSTAAICLLLAAGCAALFLPALSCDFVNLDDGDYVTENARVRQGLTLAGAWWALGSFHAANWHPLTWLSHMLDVSLFGLDPRGHHATSVLLHAANAALLFALLRSLTGAVWRSALVAAVFAVHPLRVESVVWVAERKDVLCAFFLLLSAGAYVRWLRRRAGRWYALALACFALSLAAKPMAVTLPALLLLLDWWPLGRLRAAGPVAARALLAEKLPFFALSLLSGLATLAAQSSLGAVATTTYFPPGMRAGNALAAYAAYLGKAFRPADLAVFYVHPGALGGAHLALAGGLLAAVTAACLALAGRQPWLLTGWLWYLVGLLPVIGLLQVGEQGMADRYTYLPLVGIAAAAAWLAGALIPKGRAWSAGAVLAAAAALLALAGASRAQQAHWRDSVSLMRQVIRVQPAAWWAYNNLGIALSREGRLDEALASLATATRIRPGFALAWYNQGLILAGRGRHGEAVAMFREAARLKPGYAEALVNEGMSLAALGDAGGAAARYREALGHEPRNLQARANLANALTAAGRVDEAVAEYRRALEIDPQSAEVHYNLGACLAGIRDYAGAAAAFREAVRIDGSYVEARNNLGAALMMLGRPGEAAAQLAEALRLKPDHASARANLERLRAAGHGR